MYVVLDANIVISEGFGDSAHFRVLLSSASAVGHSIFIPAPAIEEVVAKFEKMLDSKTKEVEKGLETLSRHLSKPLSSPLDDLNYETEVAQFRENLESGPNHKILDYPDTAHKELVKRAVKRTRPFDEKGSGYRDALIWESVLRLAGKVSEQVVLLSSDKDFCDNKGGLHPDLIEELVSCGQCKGKIILVRYLSHFVDTYVRPRLKESLEERPVHALNQLGVDLEDTIALSVQDSCSGEEWSHEQLDVAGEYESLYLSTVEDVSNLKIVDVREIPADQFLLRIKTTLDCAFDAFVHKSDVYILDEITIYDYDWNSHYVQAEVTQRLHCELDLVINASDPEQYNIQVLSIEPVATNDYHPR